MSATNCEEELLLACLLASLLLHPFPSGWPRPYLFNSRESSSSSARMSIPYLGTPLANDGREKALSSSRLDKVERGEGGAGDGWSGYRVSEEREKKCERRSEVRRELAGGKEGRKEGSRESLTGNVSMRMPNHDWLEKAPTPGWTYFVLCLSVCLSVCQSVSQSLSLHNGWRLIMRLCKPRYRGCSWTVASCEARGGEKTHRSWTVVLSSVPPPKPSISRLSPVTAWGEVSSPPARSLARRQEPPRAKERCVYVVSSFAPNAGRLDEKLPPYPT
ncbi:hypothetical protein LX32DRAFT_228710 [Colletotrichum zoysiae]|uniref:Uncharacterized protein n=1 Tax=Colletotrichum zoysiae TaxID=1216348 RepID=A0AAD9H3L7_9PEZI|nr:hypothetical protein LX32DRAFT_228710 [Colletotrichum zoysiae]